MPSSRYVDERIERHIPFSTSRIMESHARIFNTPDAMNRMSMW